MASLGPTLHITTIDSSTLIERLVTDPDNADGWPLVARRYGPIVRAYARRRGLSRELADEVEQETLLALHQAILGGKVDRRRGSLRALLFGIAKHKIANACAQEYGHSKRADVISGTRVMAELVADDELQAMFDREWNVAVAAECLRQAKRHVKPLTYRMYFLKVIRGWTSAAVAAAVGKSVAAVDMATHRVRAFLRRIRPQVEEAF